MRYFGARIPARALCRLRAREAGGVFVQAPRVLPLVRHAAHGGDGRSLGQKFVGGSLEETFFFAEYEHARHSSIREAKHTLGDDIELDFGGAAFD